MSTATINETKLMTQQDAIHWIAGVFQVPADDLGPETRREEINSWDSMGVLLLMAGMDEEFGIILTDADMKSMQRLDDILAVLRKHDKLAPAS